jgi:hypothetical protein
MAEDAAGREREVYPDIAVLMKLTGAVSETNRRILT